MHMEQNTFWSYKDNIEPVIKATLLFELTEAIFSKLAGEEPAFLAVVLLSKIAYDKGRHKKNSFMSHMVGPEIIKRPVNTLQLFCSAADRTCDGASQIFTETINRLNRKYW